MKIAILASDKGEKVLYLYNFFKEGNRIDIHCLLTDNDKAPVAGTMAGEGIDVIQIDGDNDLTELVERLKSADVKLLVEDGYPGEIPAPLAEYFGDAIVRPSRPESAPLEVISAIDRMNAAAHPEPEHRPAPEPAQKGKASPENKVENEWAQALDINPHQPEKPRQPEMPKQPVQSGYPGQPVYPQQPANYWRSGYTGQPVANDQQAEGNNQQPYAEPMPDTYLIWSVVITILCSLIPGIIAIIYSSKVSSRYYAGNIEGAKRASRLAQIWCIVSIVVSVIWTTLYLPLSLLG